MTHNLTYRDDGTSVRSTTDWRALARCRDVEVNLFYAVDKEAGNTLGPRTQKEGRIREAKAMCSMCPVRRQCLQFAIDVDDRWGIFGGLTPTERGRKWRR